MFSEQSYLMNEQLPQKEKKSQMNVSCDILFFRTSALLCVTEVPIFASLQLYDTID